MFWLLPAAWQDREQNLWQSLLKPLWQYLLTAGDSSEAEGCARGVLFGVPQEELDEYEMGKAMIAK